MLTLEQRYLSPSEGSVIDLGVGAMVAQTRIRSIVEPELLRQALDALAVAYPLLRSRISRDDAGYLLRYGAGDGPSFRVVDADDDPFALELNTPMDRERELARAGLFRHNGDSVVSLAVDHSVADGRLVTTLLNTLVGYYTAQVEGRSLKPIRGHGMRPAVETMLAEHYDIEGVPSSLRQFTPAALPRPALGRPVPAQRFGVGHLSLDRLGTTALTQWARVSGVTMNGLLSGAVAAALSTMVEGPIAIAFPVDLRPRLRPQLPADAQLLSIGVGYAVVSSSGNADVLELARRITTQLKAGIDLALPQRTLLARGSFDFPSPLPMTTSISNLGELDPPTLQAGAELRSIRFGTTVPHPVPILFAATTDGHLGLEIVYDRTYFTDEQMTDLTDGIRCELGRSAQSRR